METLRNCQITSFIVSQIVYEEDLSSLKEIIIKKLGFSLKEILKNGKNNYRGMIFTKKIIGANVDLHVSFYKPYYGRRDVQIRTKNKETYVFINKELLIGATAEVRDDGFTEYESFRTFNYRGIYMIFVGYESGESSVSIRAGSHFDYTSPETNYYKNELKEIEETFGKGKKWFNFL